MTNYKTIKFGGITAYCNAFIDGAERLYERKFCYLSIFGDTEQCKAIIAAFIGGREIATLFNDMYGLEFTRHPRNMTFRTAKLEQGIQIIAYCPELIELSNSSYDWRVVVGSSDKECNDKIFQLLQKHRTTPLLSQWQDWILDEMPITRQRCFGFQHAKLVKLLSDEQLEKYVKKHIGNLAKITTGGTQ
jgi:hypothetical protein